MQEYNTDQTEEANVEVLKRAYTPPELTKCGNVKELTLGAGSQFFDEGGIEPLF